MLDHARRVINDDRVQVSVLASSVDPSPVTDPDSSAYRVIERSIRQTWDLPGMLVVPYLVIGGCDAKYFAQKLSRNVLRFTAVRVESAADTARWHGVNERVLVSEYGRSIAFFHHLIGNLEIL